MKNQGGNKREGRERETEPDTGLRMAPADSGSLPARSGLIY